MTTIYECDVCGRAKTVREAKNEGWHVVQIESLQTPELIQVHHYCWRCWLFYCNATSVMRDEYDKIKGTDKDIYANENSKKTTE